MFVNKLLIFFCKLQQPYIDTKLWPVIVTLKAYSRGGKLMLLLEGNDLWVNLKTSFVDIDELLLFLKYQHFSGYLQLEFSDSQGAVFIQQGDVVNGVVALEEERNTGSKAVRSILARSRQDKNGTIKVTQLPVQNIRFLSEAYGLSVRLLHKNLSSKYSPLGDFIIKLQYEGFSGCLEIWFPVDDKRGIIFLENGRTKAIMTEELLVDLKEETPAQVKFSDSFINRAQREGVQYNAFEEA
jgi:hypothetical protein